MKLDLIYDGILHRYRRKREKLIERIGDPTRIPTSWGPFNAYCYKSTLDGMEHIAMVKVIINHFGFKVSFHRYPSA